MTIVAWKLNIIPTKWAFIVSLLPMTYKHSFLFSYVVGRSDEATQVSNTQTLRLEKEVDVVWLPMNNASSRHLSNRLDVIPCQPSYWHHSAQCKKGEIQWDYACTSWSLCLRQNFHWPLLSPPSVLVSLRDRAQATDGGVARQEM